MPTAASTDIFTGALTTGGPLLAAGAAFLAGLAASATPCVYPMVGITVSIFGAKQARSRNEAILLSSLFVLGIAALYTPLGVAVALSHSVWGRTLASPWVSASVALLFFALAASMFGAFELELPSGLQNRLSQVGGLGPRGAFLMGLVTGLIGSPCTTVPFASILGSFSTVGVWVGTMSVFFFSLGLGAPFFFVGAFAARLPKAGRWTLYVKSLFGIVMVVLAFGYLKSAFAALRAFDRALGAHVLWAVAALIVGLLIGAVHLSFTEGSALQRVRKGAGVALVSLALLSMLAWSRQPPPGKHLDWLADDVLAQAMAAKGKPMLIDFTASWCTSCQEMEHSTFLDPRVVEASSRFVALRVDGTEQDSPSFVRNAQRFGVVGLPTVVLVDATGRPTTIFRGPVDAGQLVAAMDRIP